MSKKLHMIGNSHIDPVWFWGWEEGMQEVKATFASALERMRDYPEFNFTATSAVFFRWIERVAPEMFEEIGKRVEEGRFELCGGWFLEPDCTLPSGESFARQALYAQRYFMQSFGKICTIGSNVDSFGHTGTLPQLLRQSGMTHYIFMRPRLDTPLFRWEGDDGSQLCALSLPAEYTCWFHEPTVRNIQNTLDRTTEYEQMACCFGVGNHGGGPTVENVESILSLRDSFENTTLEFSTFESFFATVDPNALPVRTGSFEKVNVGCYSIDSAFKQAHRLAEQRLVQADLLLTMARLATGRWSADTERMQPLWQEVLFNQFHDTLGGTAIRSARDEGLRQLGAAAAGAATIKALAMQDIANSTDTRGEGFPLWVFNSSSVDFEGVVEVEVEWFCQSPLTLLDDKGNELSYQRVHTDVKVRHTTLGGRRRFLFSARVPACGCSVYRLCKKEPESMQDSRTGSVVNGLYSMENDLLRVSFNKETGLPCEMVEKATGYNALRGDCQLQLWTDQRDAWGGLQGRVCADTGMRFTAVSLEKTEDGPLRQTMRAVYKCKASSVTQHYHLYAGEGAVAVETYVCWNEPWHMLKLVLPTGCATVRSEAAYGQLTREITDADEYFMHGWADVFTEETGGLCVANNAKYAFSCPNGQLGITVLRSAIYAQGNSPDWQNEQESYRYTDIGEQTFTLLLRPHRNALPAQTPFADAAKAYGAYDYLFDSCHSGSRTAGAWQGLSVDNPQVSVVLAKKAEDDDGVVVRLLNLTGQLQNATISAGGTACKVELTARRLLTLHFDLNTGAVKTVNLLEWEDTTC